MSDTIIVRQIQIHTDCIGGTFSRQLKFYATLVMTYTRSLTEAVPEEASCVV